MEVQHYKDQAGIWFKEIISRNYFALQELRTAYEKIKKVTWFDLYDSCNGTWMLTVKMGEKI